MLIASVSSLPDRKYTVLGLVEGSTQTTLGAFKLGPAEAGLERAASEKGADAVIDVRLHVTPFGESNVILTLIGTAIKFT